jgi:hypothetical protein
MYLAITVAAFGDTITLQPGAEGIDTFVDEAYPMMNYGWSQIMIVGLDFDGLNDHILIQWDISMVPPGSTIEDATMALHCASFQGTTSGSIRYNITIEPWDENVVCWDNRPLYSTSVQAFSGWPTDGAWLTSNVTTFVQKWNDGIFTNYGIYIDYTGVTGECWARLSTSDDPTAENRPKLIITYTPSDVEPVSVGRIKSFFN